MRINLKLRIALPAKMDLRVVFFVLQRQYLRTLEAQPMHMFTEAA